MANVHVISGNLYPVLGLGPPKTGSGIVFLFCNTITWMIWEQSKFFILDQGEGDGRERGRGGGEGEGGGGERDRDRDDKLRLTFYWTMSEKVRVERY